jgi:hypothetical protein
MFEYVSHKPTLPQDPRSYVEAMAWPDSAVWEVTCEEERNAFHRMGVTLALLWALRVLSLGTVWAGAVGCWETAMGWTVGVLSGGGQRDES